MNFPKSFSLTITNACNLRCLMCGQWSEEGYMHGQDFRKHEMDLNDWKHIVDQIAANSGKSLLLRGGETFLFPHIIELIKYINSKGIFISIDTNGTLLEKYAEDIVRIGGMHLTVSVDGTEEIHDKVRGLKGTFSKVKKGLEKLNELDPEQKISRSINFTISPYSYKALGQMAHVARSMDIRSITIVPYYWYDTKTGERYKNELKELGCNGYSWEGFHHEESGVDTDEFLKQLHTFKESLGDIYLFPYMPITEDQEYIDWFTNCSSQIGPVRCSNVEKLIDIQPQGDVNFCVDLIDYTFGNVKEQSIKEIWNSEQAQKFRNKRQQAPLAVCYRCGAKYMGDLGAE